MSSDTLKPHGIDKTTGVPEIATTAYDTLVGASHPAATLAGTPGFLSLVGATQVFTKSKVLPETDVVNVSAGTVSTTNATATTIETLAITASNTYLLESRVVARRTGGTAGAAEDGAVYSILAAFKTVAGVLTQIGSSVKTSIEDQNQWDVAYVISGTNVLLQVTGRANNNIDWKSLTLQRSVA